MAGGDSSASTDRSQDWQWDVVLSFAGAQRDYVSQVAEALRARGVRCFYDADEQVDLWGKHLAEELPTIYGERAAAVVLFISAEYVARDWTRLERQAALARAVRERREYVLPARFDDTPLPGLLPDIVAMDLRRYVPAEFAGLIAGKLAALGIAASDVAFGETLGRSAHRRRLLGAVRVADADLRWLGVHAAISVPGTPDEVPPEYVPRDTDAADHGVRAKVAAAAERGGFVLLIGGSSVGKTRSAAEAVRTLLPDWWLVHPTGPGEVAALAAAPPPQMVVWLDDLQRYLDGEHGLAGGTVRTLLSTQGPVVIIGTLWSDRYSVYTAMPAPGGVDPRAREREVLDLATVIRIRPEFSAAEQSRARAAATRDRRLRVALSAAGYGLTQTLAAAPQLVARWEDAQAADPYAWAVLTAALDAARLGARAPLTADLLRAAAPGYCTSAQHAEAPGNWFERALAYATAKLHGAAAALSPSGAYMGQIDGYTVADYLLQHAGRERRPVRVPASTWDALRSHLGDPADAARLGDSATDRLLYGYAISFYRLAADAGDGPATGRLARLLIVRRDLDQAEQLLRARASAGDRAAARQLALLLTERGDLDQAEQLLRAQADAGDRAAAWRLADLLTERGDIAGLRARANAGDRAAAGRLALVLTERGNLDEAEELLRARADAGDRAAARQLALLLTERGSLDEAERLLRAQADAGDRAAAWRLALLMAERGNLDGLRARASGGDHVAARQLALLLTERGELDEAEQLLRVRASAGDRAAARQLALLLTERGNLEGLRARADAGDGDAAWRLALLMAGHKDLNGLRARADANDRAAATQLARLLIDRGDLDEAEQLLRARADAGDRAAARQLTLLVAERGNLDEAERLLRARADAGDGDVMRLAELLIKRGRREEAARLRQFGLNPDGTTASE